MTPFDFIKDHLINIDGLFDKHEDGDDQKPHSPIQFHNQHSQTTFCNSTVQGFIYELVPSTPK